MKIRRRSGISTLIGAIFFVIIVVLVVGTLTNIFSTLDSSVNSIHQNNAAQIRALDSQIQVQNSTFGGVAFQAKGQVTGVSNTAQNPFLPVSNMNFTGGLSGWYVSKGFHNDTDGASVTNSPQNFQYPGLPMLPQQESFNLNVNNNDQSGGTYNIAMVTLLVDPSIVVTNPQTGFTPGWGNCFLVTCANNPPNVVGNNITWVAADLPDSIYPQTNLNFGWTATVPAAIGTYYTTVVISWIANNPLALPFTDTTITTVNSTVSTAANGGTSAGTIVAVPEGNLAGGLSAGYDADATTTSSESGPGSLYIQYQPAFNGNPLQTGQQLMSTVNFTAPFSLNGQTVASLATSNCCSVTWASSLDSQTVYRNSYILYRVFLVNPSGVYQTIDELNPTVNYGSLKYPQPTNANDFGPSGWVFRRTPFNPTNAFWVPGTYKLIVSIQIILPGASLGHAGYPTELSLHFDDIGVALRPAPPPSPNSNFYGSTTFQISTVTPSYPLGINSSLVQGMELVVNMTGAPANATAYVKDDSRFIYNPTLMVEVGSVSFDSAGSIHAVLPLPNAADYVNGTSDQPLACGAPPVTSHPFRCNYLDVRVNASSTAAFTLQVSLEAIIQTTNQNDVVVTFTNQGGASLHLVSLYISGPNGVAVFASNLAPNTFDYWVNGGSRVYTSENLNFPGSGLTSWLPGQEYTVTVTSNLGLVFSRTFTAPVA